MNLQLLIQLSNKSIPLIENLVCIKNKLEFMKSIEILLGLLNKKYTDVKSKLEKIELINSVPLEKGKGRDSYLVDKENGIVLIFNYNNILVNIYLYSEDYDGFGEFKTLPFDLKFSMNKTEVEKQFKNIQKNEGGNVNTPILGWKNLWQAYEFDKYILQVHYNKQCSNIEYIILGAKR